MKRANGLLLVVLSMALAAWACSGDADKSTSATSASAQTKTPAPQKPPTAPPRTESTKPKADVPKTLEILSVLSVEQEVDILAQRRGIVQEVKADQGTVVQKGAVLARLDDRELLAQLDKAKADLLIAQSNVKFNEAELRAKEAHFRRAQELFKAGIGSQADLEEAEFRAKGAQYDLESWRATVERQRAEIRMLELELEKTQIRAPFGGAVARRFVRMGQDVLKDDKCFRLSQLSPLLVRFMVPEISLRQPRQGDTIELVLASNPGRSYSARIASFSPVVDAASGSSEVTAQLTGADLKELRPGMAVRVLWRIRP